MHEYTIRIKSSELSFDFPLSLSENPFLELSRTAVLNREGTPPQLGVNKFPGRSEALRAQVFERKVFRTIYFFEIRGGLKQGTSS